MLGYELNKNNRLHQIESISKGSILYLLVREYHLDPSKREALLAEILSAASDWQDWYIYNPEPLDALIASEHFDVLSHVFEKICAAYPLYQHMEKVTQILNSLIHKTIGHAIEYNSILAFEIALSSARINQLDIQALFNGKYSYRLQPLIVAAANADSIDILKALLDAGADVNARDESKATALHYACSRQDTACVAELIKRGADLSAKDEYGNTPAMKAAKNNNVAALQLLYPIDVRPTHESVNITDKFNYTPIGKAAGLQQWDAVRFLIHIGADLKLNAESRGFPVPSVLHVMYGGIYSPPQDLVQSVFDQVKSTLSNEDKKSFISRFGLEDRQMHGLQ